MINQSEDGQVAPDHPIVRPVFSFGVEVYRSALVAEFSRSGKLEPGRVADWSTRISAPNVRIPAMIPHGVIGSTPS